MSVCVLAGEVFNISRSTPVEMAENSHQKYTGVQSRRLSSIVGFVGMCVEEPAPSGPHKTQVERNQRHAVVESLQGML